MSKNGLNKFCYSGEIKNYRAIFQQNMIYIILYMILYDWIWCISMKMMFKAIYIQSKPWKHTRHNSIWRITSKTWEDLENVPIFFFHPTKWCAPKVKICIHVLFLMSQSRIRAQNPQVKLKVTCVCWAYSFYFGMFGDLLEQNWNCKMSLFPGCRDHLGFSFRHFL